MCGLKKYIFPAGSEDVTEIVPAWGTAWAAAEMIRAGITTICRHVLFEDAIADEENKAPECGAILGESGSTSRFPEKKNASRKKPLTREKIPQAMARDSLIHAAVRASLN